MTVLNCGFRGRRSIGEICTCTQYSFLPVLLVLFFLFSSFIHSKTISWAPRSLCPGGLSLPSVLSMKWKGRRHVVCCRTQHSARRTGSRWQMADRININIIKFMYYALKSSTRRNTEMKYESVDRDYFIVNFGWRENLRLLYDKRHNDSLVGICHMLFSF